LRFSARTSLALCQISFFFTIVTDPAFYSPIRVIISQQADPPPCLTLFLNVLCTFAEPIPRPEMFFAYFFSAKPHSPPLRAKRCSQPSAPFPRVMVSNAPLALRSIQSSHPAIPIFFLIHLGPYNPFSCYPPREFLDSFSFCEPPKSPFKSSRASTLPPRQTFFSSFGFLRTASFFFFFPNRSSLLLGLHLEP